MKKINIDEKNKENISKIKSGDKNAISNLYTDNFDFVLKQLKYFTNCQDDALLEDITQETFVKILENIESYEITKVQFRSFLFNAAKNKFIDHKRKKKNSITDLIDFSDNPFNEEEGGNNNKKLFNVSDNSSSVIDLLVGGQLEKAVYKYLNSLEDVNRTRIFKKYINGEKYKDIAEKTDTNIGTVKSIIFHEKKKIKEILAEQNYI